jgi:hypothetical protein
MHLAWCIFTLRIREDASSAGVFETEGEMRRSALISIAIVPIAIVAILSLAHAPQAQEPNTSLGLDRVIHGYESVTHKFFAGAPEDWSTHHVRFSQPEPGSDAEYQVQKDPRFWLQGIRQEGTKSGGAFVLRKLALPHPKPELKNDWAQSIGAGGKVFAGQYPAKFSLNPNTNVTAANCTSDYAIYNTGLAGSTTQASIIGYSNLYPGTCTGTVPGVAWAYNTSGLTPAGAIETSVTLSSDGKQIAFVTSGTTANLVLLKLPTANATGRTITPVTTASASTTVTAASGSFSQTDVGARVTGGSGNIPAGDTIAAFVSSSQVTLATAATGTNTSLTIAAETLAAPGVAPLQTSAANYAACTGPCSFSFSLGAADAVSAPYYDFGSDSIFVGTTTGVLRKYNPVFNGTPAFVTSITVSTGAQALTSPVYDASHSLVLVGDAHASGATNDGAFHTVNSTLTTVTSSTLGICHGAGYVDAPLVDPTAGRAYIACGDDQGGGACTADTTCMRQFSYVALSGAGIGAQIGASTTDTVVYSGAFDNTYLNSNNATPTGNLYICGNAGGPPTLFRVPITTNTMGTVVTVNTLSASSPATNTNACGPVTEFFNSTTAVDWLFVGETLTGNKTGCTTAGCVYSFNATSAIPANTNATAGFASTGGSSGIIIDNIGSDVTDQIANIYFSALSNVASCNGSPTVGCAYQVRQDIL